jgi:Ca2+/Na+ antiporter
MFDLEKNGAFREPSKAEMREDRDREYNKKMKSTMRFIGENMATCTIVLATTLLVGSVFGDLGVNILSEYMLMDFVLTFAVFLLVEYMASKSGARCGKTYDEYVTLHKLYLNMREEIYKRGIALMDMFCDWQVDVEYEYYIRRRCKKLKIDYKEYVDKYSKMSLEELSDMFTHKGEEKPKFSLRHPIRTAIAIHNYTKVSELAKDIVALKAIKPIELTPEILLTDGKPRRTRGGVGISGEEHLERKTTGAGHIVVTIFMTLLTVLPVFVAKGWSWTLIFAAAMKLVGVFMRYYRGYSSGAQAFNTVEVKHIQDKVQYFHLYNEFLNKRLYIDLEGRYGDLPKEIKKEAVNENKRGDSFGGQPEAEHDLGRTEVHVGV